MSGFVFTRGGGFVFGSIQFDSIQFNNCLSIWQARQDKSATQRRTHCLEHNTGDSTGSTGKGGEKSTRMSE